MPRREKAFSICSGQQDLFGAPPIHICDICGKKNSNAGRHKRCENKIPRAEKLVRRWCEKAVQKEVATKKKQEPPLSLKVLARHAGISIYNVYEVMWEGREKE